MNLLITMMALSMALLPSGQSMDRYIQPLKVLVQLPCNETVKAEFEAVNKACNVATNLKNENPGTLASCIVDNAKPYPLMSETVKRCWKDTSSLVAVECYDSSFRCNCNQDC